MSFSCLCHSLSFQPVYDNINSVLILYIQFLEEVENRNTLISITLAYMCSSVHIKSDWEVLQQGFSTQCVLCCQSIIQPIFSLLFKYAVILKTPVSFISSTGETSIVWNKGVKYLSNWIEWVGHNKKNMNCD